MLADSERFNIINRNGQKRREKLDKFRKKAQGEK